MTWLGQLGLALTAPTPGWPAFEFSIPRILGEGLSFRIDGMSFLFIVAATIPWLLSFFFSIPYFRAEERASLPPSHQTHPDGRNRCTANSHAVSHHDSLALFYAAFALSFIFAVATFAANDLFTAFYAFEGLTLSSYFLVRYENTADSSSASSLYLFMSLAGGLALLGGIMVLKARTGSTAYARIGLLTGRDLLVTAIPIILGFGVKAGIWGLHAWLPRAHPVAPSPASAVLSGVMIKVGAYGILRTTLAIAGADPVPISDTSTGAGAVLPLVLAFLGLANIWWGGICALRSGNMKQVLAYSSVSQMGYILTAMSQVAADVPTKLVGLSGALLHVLNHALFKSLLFLVSGALLMDRGSVELNRLRGALRGNTWALAAFLAGMLSITGVPGLGGFISKTLIHDSLVSASKGSALWTLVEKGFTLGSALTALYFLRLLWFLWTPSEAALKAPGREVREPTRVLVPLVFSAYVILLAAVGLFPHACYQALIVPAMLSAGFGSGSQAETIHELETFQYITWPTVAPIIQAWVLAGVSFVTLRKLLFSRQTSRGDTLADNLSAAGQVLAREVSILNGAANWLFSALDKSSWVAVSAEHYVEDSVQRGYSWTARRALGLTRAASAADGEVNAAYTLLDKGADLTMRLFGLIEKEDHSLVGSASMAARAATKAAGRQEHLLGGVYRAATKAGQGFVELSGQVDRDTNRGYESGARAAQAAANLAGDYALRFRPPAPGAAAERRDRMAALIIAATILLTVVSAAALLMLRPR